MRYRGPRSNEIVRRRPGICDAIARLSPEANASMEVWRCAVLTYSVCYAVFGTDVQRVQLGTDGGCVQLCGTGGGCVLQCVWYVFVILTEVGLTKGVSYTVCGIVRGTD
eukprot:3930602-Rhodomonas_salina.1